MDEFCNEAVAIMEAPFKLHAIEYEGTGEEEESLEEMTLEEAANESADEDGGDSNDEYEEEEEEEDDLKFDPASSARERRMQMGASGHYCPVTLQVRDVLAPGSVEFQCKYREKVFRFISDEARQQFMLAPEKFLPNKRHPRLSVPAPRIVIMGPRGSGELFILFFVCLVNFFHLVLI